MIEITDKDFIGYRYKFKKFSLLYLEIYIAFLSLFLWRKRRVQYKRNIIERIFQEHNTDRFTIILVRCSLKENRLQ